MIRIGIVGYGNLGRGVELALKNHNDMKLVGIFTRRNPHDIKNLTKNIIVDYFDNLNNYINDIDVLILCGGSKADLPIQSQIVAKNFCFVDSYDNHGNIPKYYECLEPILKSNHKTGLISTGWDPGLFSLSRLLFSSILPNGNTYTFWGKGVSQGHSDAIRQIDGVKMAVQYTIPIAQTVQEVKQGLNKVYTTNEKHLRECFVVSQNASENDRITQEIKEMPNYFRDYNTIVHFISEEEFRKNHTAMPHGGHVIHSAKTGLNDEHNEIMEFNLTLASNPEFTSSVLVCYARAVFKMNFSKQYGCKTVFDIPLKLLSPKTEAELREALL